MPATRCRSWQRPQVPARDVVPLCANFNVIVFDYICRQKVQKNHLNWYIVEQLPVAPPERYDAARFGPKTAAEIVREVVLGADLYGA